MSSLRPMHADSGNKIAYTDIGIFQFPLNQDIGTSPIAHIHRAFRGVH